ncbi:hypothetical protein G3O08_06555 [Cryomorpha ignava]|uniref:Uncharacterized protein n=1 Tax=Cryomorpha ignava TaxID=101383 RepID=A0A7K3WNQ4_9FLAO|nr:hypothetical protein [Cryomorpha ignava]NEN23158.1 hypothetical protein [Cryomorpha ignava]
MISKFFIIAAIVGLLPGTSNQSSKTALISGLEYALTQSKIADAYGLEATSDKKNCKKIVVVNSTKNLDKSAAAYFNESELCIVAKQKQDMFFLSIQKYFEIEKFSVDDNQYTLSLQLISPEYNPSANKQMFWVLKYSLTDGLINVQSFDQVVQDN